ncbi:MAG TPA: NPCBM/NEW2 domain-containing protein [Polyangiaceae bacterium]|nr:NPCBM/NEW2 domain-containing protein [Polyangiaceae bacterium]
MRSKPIASPPQSFPLRGRELTTGIALITSVALLACDAPPATGEGSGAENLSAPNSTPPINDLAKTPYQGWNTFFGLNADFNEQIIEAEADALVNRGLKAAGYQYVWIDGGWWSGTRDSAGNITVNATQWPHGMKAVADYIHGLGLKAGIYTDSGINGCGGPNQGSYGHYQQDVDQFAAWGYDAVKVDFCGSEKMGLDPATQYGQFRDALLANSSHRPMLFNICNPFVPFTGAPPGKTAYDSYKFGPTTGNSWRTDTDVGFPRNVVFVDVLRNLDDDAKHPEAAGPGHWNDPDYLVPENGMTDDEAQAQFSMWAIVAAPLVIGSDVKALSDNTIAKLTNREWLAIDQDPIGIQGTAIATSGNTQVWTKPLSNGEWAVALFNRGTTAQVISTIAKDVGLPCSDSYALRDVWQHTTTETAGKIAATVAPHSVVLLRVSRHGDVASTAPSVVAAPANITSAAQAVLPLVEPGSTFSVSTSFANNGRLTVSDAKFTLSVPAGWTASTVGTTTASRLRTGEVLSGKWQVTAPAGTVPGPNPVKISTSYTWSNATHRSQEHVAIDQSSTIQVPNAPPSATSALSHHPWLDGISGYLVPRVDREVAGGGSLVMVGTTYPDGIGTNGPSAINFYVGGACTLLTGTVGIDDSVNFDPNGGTSVFQVFGDGVKLYDSGLVTRTAPQAMSVNLGASKVLTLVVGDGGDGGYNDRADWGHLQITCGAPVSTIPAGPWPHYVAPVDESATATSANDGNPASAAVDGDVTTIWHSQFSPVHDPLPVSFTLDLKSAQTVTGLTYLPRLDGTINGTITSYAVDVSTDGVNFTAAAPAGSWPQDALLKSVQIAPVSGRYVRLTASAGAFGYASAAEIAVAIRPAK